MADRLQVRRDTAAAWQTANPVLADGEMAFERETDILKIGDGVTPWNSLMPSVYYPSLGAHVANTTNPHSVTKTQVGLGNVDNTSDATKNAATATLTNKKLLNYSEEVYDLTGTVIDPANASIQTKTLSANTTFTESLASGTSVILGVDDGTGFTVTWPTITWTTTPAVAPNLPTTGYLWVVLWKVGTTLYGKY